MLSSQNSPIVAVSLERPRTQCIGGCMLQESPSSVKQNTGFGVSKGIFHSNNKYNLLSNLFYLGDYQKVLATFGAGRSISIKVFNIIIMTSTQINIDEYFLLYCSFFFIVVVVPSAVLFS